MKCRKSERAMIRLLETPNNSPEWKPLQEHLAICPRCQDSLRMLQFSRQILERPVTDAELGPYFMPRLMASVREAREEKEVNWGLVWRYSSKLMAFSFVLLLLLVGTLFYEFAGLPSESSVVVDSVMEPSFSDRSVNDLLLQTDHPQKDQVLEALLSSGGQFKR
jgi:hypothetical protein